MQDKVREQERELDELSLTAKQYMVLEKEARQALEHTATAPTNRKVHTSNLTSNSLSFSGVIFRESRVWT